MRTFTKEELKNIITLHEEWLAGRSKGTRADLNNANLRNANLNNADLNNANLKYADLRNADLSNANLNNANLNNANLRYANLRYADLSNADLNNADLRYADLRYATYNYLSIGLNLSCPEVGCFTAFKKACNDVIVTLQITEDAKRSSATTRKCRASKAKVIAIDNGLKEICSNYDSSFIYKLGEIVEIKDFDENRWNECSTGIHFFMTRKEAEEY